MNSEIHGSDGLFLTKGETAKLLKVSGRTIDNWCYAGILPYSKIGTSKNAVVRISRADIDTMIGNHRKGGQ